VALALVAATGACDEDPPALAAADQERIEVMRSDPVFAYLVGDQLTEGIVVHGEADHHTYTGYLDPWRGRPVPDPGPDQLRAQVVRVLDDLRAGGWTMVGARCEVTGDEPTHTWQARGYRFHDGVPYTVFVWATYPLGDGDHRPTPLSVEMSTPHHADPDTGTYLNPPPDPLPAGSSCLEQGEPATGPGTVVDGVMDNLWDR